MPGIPSFRADANRCGPKTIAAMSNRLIKTSVRSVDSFTFSAGRPSSHTRSRRELQESEYRAGATKSISTRNGIGFSCGALCVPCMGV